MPLSLTRVKLPDSLIAIGSAAFMAAIHLEEINWPKNLKYIGDSAFCTSALKTIVLPEGLVYLGGSAFKNCCSAKAAVVPEGITELNDLVFNYCEALITLTLPKSLEKIGEWAVSSCKELRFIRVLDGADKSSHFHSLLDGYYNKYGVFTQKLVYPETGKEYYYLFDDYSAYMKEKEVFEAEQEEAWKAAEEARLEDELYRGMDHDELESAYRDAFENDPEAEWNIL